MVFVRWWEYTVYLFTEINAHSTGVFIILFSILHQPISFVCAYIYRVNKNDCRGFNNLSYTIHLRYEYIVAPMDQEILKVFFYDEFSFMMCGVQ